MPLYGPSTGGGGGGLADGDYGDIVVSGSASVFSIDSKAVTLGKMADLAANSIIGNNTGAPAAPLALTAAQVKTLLAIVAGDVGGLAAVATSGSASDLTAGTLPDARLSANPQALAGLGGAADKLPYFTGAGAMSLTDLTGVARTLLAQATQAAMRTTGLGLGSAALLASDTDTTLAANSDANVATQKAVKAYIDSLLAAQDALTFEGGIDCSANPNYPAADCGHFYKITVAGKIGGGSGAVVQAGDTMYCTVDGSAAGTQAAVGANWVIVQVNIDGAVVGPASATDGNLAAFDGATGKLIKELTPAQVRTLLTLGALALQGDGDKGDITVSASGATWTIDAGVVTLAKQADVATGTLFYRKTAGAGAPEVKTLATLKTDLLLTGTNSGDETATSIGAIINGATVKGTPVDADMLGLMDSAGSNVLKKLSWSNFKGAFKAYYDAVVSTFTHKTFDTAGAGNSLLINGLAATANTGTGAVVRAAGATVTGLKGYANVDTVMNWYGKNFNGVTTYLHSAALTPTNAKAGTFALWVRLGAAAAVETFLHHSGTRIIFERTANGTVDFQIFDSGAASIRMRLTTTTGACAAAGDYKFLVSWNVAVAGTGRLYVNDVSNCTVVTYTDTVLGYQGGTYSIGARSGGSNFLSGDIYAIYFDFVNWTDFDIESNRRKFHDANLTMVPLGRNGEVPSGSAPGMCHAYDEALNWARNRGTLTATYTSAPAGAPVNATTVGYGAWIPPDDLTRPVTITASPYTVQRYDGLLINNVGATLTVTLPAASEWHGRVIPGLNIGGAFAMQASAAVIVPKVGGAAAAGWLAATDGVSGSIVSIGTNWQLFQ
jgi:hypothetical protein